MKRVLFLPFCLAALAVADDPRTTGNKSYPVTKVVKLLQGMRDEVAKDQATDTEAHGKFQCWCKTNNQAKVEDIASAKQSITELENFIEASKATMETLQAEIRQHTQEIADSKASMASATEIRKKEYDEFKAMESDTVYAVESLNKALGVLSKVHQDHDASALLQVQETLEHVQPQLAYVGAMQKDLWDLLSAVELTHEGGAFLTRRVGRHQAALPADAQAGLDAKPNDLEGQGAGAKSYNSRSGRIVGILEQMLHRFDHDLASARKEEARQVAEYDALMGEQQAQMDAASAQKQSKEDKVANLELAVAASEANLEATQANLAADEQFLTTLNDECSVAKTDFEERDKSRAEELVAIAEAIKILSEDAARDVFSKTLGFLQIHAHEDSSESARQAEVMDRAISHIIAFGQRHKDYSFVAFALRAKLDSFTKVLEAIDTLSADLKTQQDEEVAHRDECTQNIHDQETSIIDVKNKGNQLNDKLQKAKNDLHMLTLESVRLQSESAETAKDIQEANVTRTAAHRVFEESLRDQRDAIATLAEAFKVLQDFYHEKGSSKTALLVEPGQAISAKPSKGVAYKKHEGGVGVLEMIEHIIQEAHAEEVQLVSTDKKEQEAYEKLTAELNESLSALANSMSSNHERTLEVEASENELKIDLDANHQETAQQEQTLQDLHSECDFLIVHFDVRQQKRGEEIEALAQAKAILSGAL